MKNMLPFAIGGGLGLGLLILFTLVKGGASQCAVDNLELKRDIAATSFRLVPIVTATLTNSGANKEFSIEVNLDSSNGRINRSQRLRLNQGEARKVIFRFDEVSESATNVQVNLACGPA